jgi:hypothetical protein
MEVEEDVYIDNLYSHKCYLSEVSLSVSLGHILIAVIGSPQPGRGVVCFEWC